MKELRSKRWFGETGKNGFIYRAWLKNQGIPDDEFNGKPIIGICNTWSELTPCNAHFRDLAESIKKGVYEAGGVPFEFPVTSLGEATVKPTAMLFRNLMSMDVEESIRMNPLDGVVLMCGCDKTTPASIMGAASVDLPTIVLSGGPMLTGNYKGKRIGTSDVWRYAEMARNDEMSQEDLRNIEEHMCRSIGHCAVMGTASTMACMVESLGLSLPQNASIPAADSRRKVLAQKTGRRIVEMVKEHLNLSKLLTLESFENAIKINAAIGGSTNFIIHLLAIAHRVGVKIELGDFDRLSKNIPLLANLHPSGDHFMEDFFYAGGLPVLIKELSGILDMDAITLQSTVDDRFDDD
ncbi:MAG: dihydroxy-acid dehydratase, partial [Bacteroidota bacterium]